MRYVKYALAFIAGAAVYIVARRVIAEIVIVALAKRMEDAYDEIFGEGWEPRW